MKVSELRATLAFMRVLPDEALGVLADGRYFWDPRDYFDRVVVTLAAGEQEWRASCR